MQTGRGFGVSACGAMSGDARSAASRKSWARNRTAAFLAIRQSGRAVGPVAGAVLAVLLLLAGSGCADRDRVSRPDPTTADGFTDRGWDEFEDGDLEAALADFASAIALDPAHGAAYTGQGWARMGLAGSAGDMNTAVQSFDNAEARGETGADNLAGRAAAHLGRGTAGAADAIADAAAARAAATNYTFPYRSSFDTDDLFLIEAFALASQGDFDGAVAAADEVEGLSSGIVESSSATWVVDGITYPTFEGAALAWLNKVSGLRAG